MIRTALILTVISLGGAFSLVSCNTVSGFGEDLQRAGESIEDTGEGRTW